MCYIFEKHRIQGYQIWHNRVWNVKYINTKCLKDPACAMFLKSMGFKDISLNPMLLKNIAHVGSFKHFVFVYLRICVIVYLCIFHLIHGNVIFDILESRAFQNYSTCWVLSLSLLLSLLLSLWNLKNLKNLKKWLAGSLLAHDEHWSSWRS